MPIYLNGSLNPLAVNYGATALDAVYATIDGVSSVWPVWERDAAFPETLGTVVVTYANGVKAYYRNMTLGYVTRYSSDGKCRGRYNGDVTLEVSFSKGRQIGAESAQGAPLTWWANSSSITATSGIPSGYEFYSGGSEDSSANTLAFDVYHTTDGILRESQRVATNLQSYITLDKSGNADITTYMPGNYWPVLTRSTGWVYQGEGFLLLMHS